MEQNLTDTHWSHRLSSIREKYNVKMTDSVPFSRMHCLRNGTVLNIDRYDDDGLEYLCSKKIAWEDIIYGRHQDKLKNLSTEPDEAGYVWKSFTPQAYVKSTNQFIRFVNVEWKYCPTTTSMSSCELAFELTDVDSIAYYLQVYGVTVSIGTVYRANATKIIWDDVAVNK
jgi:hypothetical protein